MAGQIWTEDELNILHKYKDLTAQDLVEYLPGRTKRAIQQKRRLLGISKPVKRYNINIDFFKTWSPEMAYILGFIYADGYVNEKDAYLRIEINDKVLLELINQKMDSDYLVIPRKRKGSVNTIYYLNISNSEIVKDLVKLGVRQAKSNIMKFPRIPSQFFWDFMRGYFDGDGTVNITKSNGLSVAILTGSKSFAYSVKNKFENRKMRLMFEEINQSIDNQCSKTKYRITIQGNSRKYFYNKLYFQEGKFRADMIYLERKYLIMRKYFEELRKIICISCGQKVEKTGSRQKKCKKCSGYAILDNHY